MCSKFKAYLVHQNTRHSSIRERQWQDINYGPKWPPPYLRDGPLQNGSDKSGYRGGQQRPKRSAKTKATEAQAEEAID